MQLKIDKEFQKLIPPLQSIEYNQLEENIIANGCQDSLKVWDGLIVDGHNRYKICTAHDIPFQVTEMHFEDRDRAMEWIILNQFGRRNLLPFQRSELALKLKPLVKEKAKENSVKSGERFGKGLQKSEKPIKPVHTDEEISKMAGVSRFIINQSETILEKGTDEQKERARTGGKGNTVNAIYNEIVNKDVSERKCEVCGEVLPIDRFDGSRKTCKSCSNQRRATKNTDIKFVQSVVDDVRDYTPCEYLAENLAEDLGALNADYIKKFKTALAIHKDLLETEEGIKKAIAALMEAGTAIATLKGEIDYA